MVKRYLKAIGVKKRIEIIPTGVPIEKVESRKSKVESRKKLGLPIEGKILLFSGRLSNEKNIPFLLNAFPAIQAQYPDVYFVLVGSGPKEKEYRGTTGSQQHRIIFTGQIPHPDIYEYYQAADLFVYASLTETQGLVLSEAKACGLPIVALFAGGLVDVVESGLDGYLIPRNEAAFVEHVVRLLRDDPLRAKMSGRAAADARERFSSIVVAKQMETLYNSLKQRGYALA
jgi:glycosyltransferase involved in cell wall biosynthesis